MDYDIRVWNSFSSTMIIIIPPVHATIYACSIESKNLTRNARMLAEYNMRYK